MEDQFAKFKQKFIEEASELIDNLENDLIKLESDPADKGLIESVFRCMHTLKGVSSMYGFVKISEITHQLENIYDFVREDKLNINSQVINITLATADYIRTSFDKNNDEASLNSLFDQISGVICQIINNVGIENETIATIKKSHQKKNGFATWLINFTPDENIITRGVNLIFTFSDLFELGTYHISQNEHNSNYSIYLYTDKKHEDIEDVLLFIADECKITKIADYDIFNEEELNENIITPTSIIEVAEETEVGEIIEKKVETPVDIEISSTAGAQSIARSKINVDAEKLDELMYLVSELIITNSQINLIAKNKTNDVLKPLLEKIDSLSKLFRNNTLSLRLISINDVIIRFKRLVHDLSIKLGKKIELVTQGTETELDKSTIDALIDPLMHIIRNCIDHGIETPEIRKQKGKAGKGIIKISASHSGNFVFIEIEDDGKGIDTKAIQQKAIEKGIIGEDTQLTDKETYDLIFLPGFSTAQSLTQVSGRGVGLDVVKNKIAELRGEIEIASEIGVGTCFTLKLHQTVAILDTLLFKIDDMFLLVPISDVLECGLIENTSLQSNTDTVPYNDQLITYTDLYSIFKLKRPDQKRLKMIVIERQGKIFAITADTIIGEHQAVLKSLGSELKEQDKITGASILGDGNLAYLLDLAVIQALIN